jgi:exonuclease V gamma subunit
MMYHDTIDYSQYNISDTEKFLVMTKVFPELFVNQKAFAEEIGENPQTVNSWIKLKTRKLKAIPKSEICRVFGLIDTVWDCELSTQENFREVLKKDYRKKRKGVNIFIMEEENDIKEQSLLEQAIAYKRNDRIKEALESIKKIERSPSSFKYIHHDEIQHLKAILLSDDTIQD